MYSQLTSWCQGITALQHKRNWWSYLSVPCFIYLCIWKSTEISEHCCVSTGVTNSGLALGFVCKTLLFCVVKLFHSSDASRNLTALFHRYTYENPSPKNQTRTNFKSCPTKGRSVTWHSWLQPFTHSLLLFLLAWPLHPACCYHKGCLYGVLLPRCQDLPTTVPAQPLRQRLLQISRLVSSVRILVLMFLVSICAFS